MRFPRIETLGDIEAHAASEKGFVIFRRPDYTVVDYVYVVDDTFQTAEQLECRGLKFDREGRIIGRPFHKFFNIGERQLIDEIDLGTPYHIQFKLDGSMVHPVLLNGNIVFMTRMGITAQSKIAEQHARAERDLSRHLLDAGITPLFEYTSPETRIVVDYDRPKLTLLAARETISGAYMPHRDLERVAAEFGVALVEGHEPVETLADFIKRARAETGIEGYVLVFDDGHRLKLKTESYVLRHKALAGIRLEKNVLAFVCEGTVDDLVPLLPASAAEPVLAYRDSVLRKVEELARRAETFAAEHAHLSRKDFAAACFGQFDTRLTATAFNALDGKDVRGALMNMLTSAAQSEPRIDAIRDLFGMRWSYSEAGLPDIEI